MGFDHPFPQFAFGRSSPLLKTFPPNMRAFIFFSASFIVLPFAASVQRDPRCSYHRPALNLAHPSVVLPLAMIDDRSGHDQDRTERAKAEADDPCELDHSAPPFLRFE